MLSLDWHSRELLRNSFACSTITEWVSGGNKDTEIDLVGLREVAFFEVT